MFFCLLILLLTGCGGGGGGQEPPVLPGSGQSPGNASPVIVDIPDQNTLEDSLFTPIDLNDYVSDADNSDSDISWSHSGNNQLMVLVDANNVATIMAPADWFGTETISFRATDLDLLFAEDSAVFTMTPVNDPPSLTNIPDQVIMTDGDFEPILLNDHVDDPDNTDEEINWSYSGNKELSVSIDQNHRALITPADSQWYGFETITFTATDPGGVSSSRAATFTRQLDLSEFFTNSHQPHLRHGPGNVIQCNSCHGSEIPEFADGKDFAQTEVCLDCHQPNQLAAVKRGFSTPGTWQAGEDTQDFCASCHASQKSHPPHLAHGGGAVIGCHSCHRTEPDFTAIFKDGKDLARTQVCATCHSDDRVAAAKTYFEQPGSWTAGGSSEDDCVSCHSRQKSHPSHLAHAGGTLIECESCHKTVPISSASFKDDRDLADTNVCATCHSQDRIAAAKSFFDNPGDWLASEDQGKYCGSCHSMDWPPHRSEFFSDNCLLCHVTAEDGSTDLSSRVPSDKCLQCHGERDVHSSDPAKNPYDTGQYTYEVDCVDCHDPMFSVAGNRQLLKPNIADSAIVGSSVVNTTRFGEGSLGDGSPHNENVCETCHTLTKYHRYNGMAPGDFDDAGNYIGHHDGTYCMVCHDHNESFMVPGSSADP